MTGVDVPGTPEGGGVPDEPRQVAGESAKANGSEASDTSAAGDAAREASHTTSDADAEPPAFPPARPAAPPRPQSPPPSPSMPPRPSHAPPTEPTGPDEPAEPPVVSPAELPSHSADSVDPARQVCGALRLDLGAYVLGALDEDETQWVRSHVAVCPECRAAYDELAVLPPLLALLTPAEAEASGAASEPVPERLFTAAAERAQGDKRRRTVVLAAAAAALAMVVGTLGWAIGAEDEDTPSAKEPATGAPPSATSPPPPAPSTPPAGQRTVQASDAESGAAMTLDYRPASYGTGIDLKLSGVPAGTRCQLDVFGTRGRHETASSWVVPEGGYGVPGGTLTVPGATSIPPDEIVSFKITVVGKDETLLTGKPQEIASKSPVARRRISPFGHLRLDI